MLKSRITLATAVAAGIVVLALAGGYIKAISVRKAHLADLILQEQSVSQGPDLRTLEKEAQSLKDTLDQRSFDLASTRLGRITHAFESAGLTDRSVATREPTHTEGLTFTPVRIACRGSSHDTFNALLDEQITGDGVFVQRLAIKSIPNDPDQRLTVEMELILVQPE